MVCCVLSACVRVGVFVDGGSGHGREYQIKVLVVNLVVVTFMGVALFANVVVGCFVLNCCG